MSHSTLGFESSDLDEDDGGCLFGAVVLSYAPFSITGYPLGFQVAPPKDGSTSADAHPRLRAELSACPWKKPHLMCEKSPMSATTNYPIRKGKAYCVACRCRVAVNRLELHHRTPGHHRAEQNRNAERSAMRPPAFASPLNFGAPPLKASFHADISFGAYPLNAPRPLTGFQPALPQPLWRPPPPPPLFGRDITSTVLALFPCPKCPAAFNSHNDVLAHVQDRAHRIHYGPTKVFPDCSVCGMAFESCAARNKHMNETNHEFCVNYTNNSKKAGRLLNVAETPFWTQLRHLRATTAGGQSGIDFTSDDAASSTTYWNTLAASVENMACGSVTPQKKKKNKTRRRENRELRAAAGFPQPKKKKKKQPPPHAAKVAERRLRAAGSGANAARNAENGVGSSSTEKNRNSNKKQRRQAVNAAKRTPPNVKSEPVV